MGNREAQRHSDHGSSASGANGEVNAGKLAEALPPVWGVTLDSGHTRKARVFGYKSVC